MHPAALIFFFVPVNTFNLLDDRNIFVCDCSVNTFKKKSALASLHHVKMPNIGQIVWLKNQVATIKVNSVHLSLQLIVFSVYSYSFTMLSPCCMPLGLNMIHFTNLGCLRSSWMAYKSCVSLCLRLSSLLKSLFWPQSLKPLPRLATHSAFRTFLIINCVLYWTFKRCDGIELGI